eukprot:gb/GECH01013307.1/.p1 GENE.gb/GECH01013307.1/~~gb/GECH01013307.1/.p1  ORF type:complete len:317 (+),score=78.52 gb/GECH01013307.1/:1-951(+)
MGNAVCSQEKDLTDQHVLITGANVGVGLETAVALASMGKPHIHCACRNSNKGEKAIEEIKKRSGNDQIYLHSLDLSSLESVRNLVKEYKSNGYPLNILINNAGVGKMGAGYEKTSDGFELHFGTNHLGHFLLTNLLLDTIKSSAPARIITLASKAHQRHAFNMNDPNDESMTLTSWTRYCNSKMANILFTYALARRLDHSGQENNHETETTNSSMTNNSSSVQAVCVHPGVVASNFFDNTHGVWRPIVNSVKPMLFKTPKQGAQTSIYCAVASNIENGKYYTECAAAQSLAETHNEDLQEQLWRKSEEMVSLNNQE